jgi:ribonuclease P protein component
LIHEANISAERQPAQENTRLPGAHADEERTLSPEAPARQREEEASSVTDSGRGQRFRPEDRIRRKVDFDRAYASGRRIPSKSFTLIALAAGLDRPRLGVTISKRVGGAVTRNSVRRRIREAFRRNRDAISSDIDIVIHVRPAATKVRFQELEAELLAAFRRYNSRKKRSG